VYRRDVRDDVVCRFGEVAAGAKSFVRRR
jgi:hypothetical protein